MLKQTMGKICIHPESKGIWFEFLGIKIYSPFLCYKLSKIPGPHHMNSCVMPPPFSEYFCDQPQKSHFFSTNSTVIYSIVCQTIQHSTVYGLIPTLNCFLCRIKKGNIWQYTFKYQMVWFTKVQAGEFINLNTVFQTFHFDLLCCDPTFESPPL